MHTMFACLNRKVLDEQLVQKVVYRDELTKKQKPIASSKAVKKSVRFADSEPTILGELENEKDIGKRGSGNEGEKGGVRVKVKMTKEEAARLLAKCKEGGVIEFRDVARELVSIPVNRVTVVSTCTNNNNAIPQHSLL